ncbi:hypothetical protein M8C21_032956, partial [Ambrosia artemisiifolia]
MSMQNDELSKNLLHCQTHIWNHIFSFIKSMSLKCAIQLQIPDIIDRHGSPMLLSELWILHDWSDENCIKILKNCKDAISSKQNGGKLVIIDMVVKVDEGDDELFESQLLFDVLMMTSVSGRERTEKDWAKLFLNGGFSDYKISPILVEALGLKPERTQSIYRLMRMLVHSGFFVKQSVSSTRGYSNEEGEGYSLAPPSRLLLKEDPLSIRPFLLAMLDPLLMDPWQSMTKWFHNDDVTPFHTTHGGSLWDLAGQEPRVNRLFNEAMASDARLVTSVILKHCGGVFQGLDSIVDVGGGTGTVAKAIIEAFPTISCISFDLPHVVNGLVGSKNLTYVGGDMFEALPNANAILLKNCKEAIPCKQNGGKLVIIDMVMKVDQSDDELFQSQLFFDMLMMTLVSGRERTEKEWAKLFLDGGFNDYKITPILGSRSLI